MRSIHCTTQSLNDDHIQLSYSANSVYGQILAGLVNTTVVKVAFVVCNSFNLYKSPYCLSVALVDLTV